MYTARRHGSAVLARIVPILPRPVRTTPDIRASLWLVVILRIALGLAGILTVLLDPRPLLRDVAAWTTLEVVDGRPWTLLFSIWQRWDALWYQEIATEGYHAGNNTAAFFPLFPLLSRIASVPFLGNVTLGELAVTTIACVAALVLLNRIARVEIGRRAAMVAILLVVFFQSGSSCSRRTPKLYSSRRLSLRSPSRERDTRGSPGSPARPPASRDFRAGC